MGKLLELKGENLLGKKIQKSSGIYKIEKPQEYTV